MQNDFARRLAPLPLVAILRGLEPEAAEAVGSALVEAGFLCIEVPLNSPRPFDSIAILAERFGSQAVIGAGTVLQRADVGRVFDAGGTLVVMPHADVTIVAEAKRRGMACTPGAATPTEAFAVLVAGADAVKMFPGESLPAAVVKAWRAVMPAGTWLMPVGGVTPESMRDYVAAGANGFGIGSALFKPGIAVTDLRRNAKRFVRAWQALRGA